DGGAPAEASSTQARKVEKKSRERIVAPLVSDGKPVLGPCAKEHRDRTMGKNIQERPESSVAVAYAVKHQFRIVTRKDAADASHAHEIDNDFRPCLAIRSVRRFDDLMDLARREIHCDPGTKSRDLLIRKSRIPNRLFLRVDLFEKTHRLEKFEPVRFITQRLM